MRWRNKFPTTCFICLLMLTLFSPVLTGEEVASLSPVSTLPAAAPLPLWNENDSWEYTITMDIKGNNSEYFTITNGHLLLSVTGLNAENYTLFFSGEIEGEGESAIIGHFELLSSTMEGYLEINRFDFSLKKIHDVIVSGYAKVTPFLFIPYEITINSLNTSDNFPLLMFPLSVGTTWYTPSTTLNVEGEISTSSYTTNIDLVNYSTPLFFFNCTETTVFYVEKHGLNLLVYNVSEELNNTVDLMYSPAVSSIVKLSCKNLPLGNYSLSLEACLTDSSYLQGNDKPVINTVSIHPVEQEPGGYVNISCEITDNIDLEEVLVNITYPDGNHVNLSMSYCNGLYYLNRSYSNIGIHQFFIWVNDTNGNSNKSEVYVFNITAACDDEKPEISFVTASPVEQFRDGYVNITCNVMDNVAVNKVMVNITYPDGGSHNLSMLSADETIFYLNQSYPLVGTYSYFIWVKDVNGNSNTSDVEGFVVVNPSLKVRITQPKTRSLYFKNHLIKFLHPRTTVIIGQLDVKAQVEGGEGNVTVRFYLENDHQATVTQPPYKYTLNTRCFGKKCSLRVAAEDENSNVSQDSIIVRIFL